MVKGRGDVDASAVGGAVVAPEEFAVGGRDADQGAGGELDVLALAVKVDGNRGGVCRATAAAESAAAPTTSRWTAAASVAICRRRRRGRKYALPDRLAAGLIESDHHRGGAAGRDDDFPAVHQRRFSISQGRWTSAKIFDEALLPDDLAVTGRKARNFTAVAFDIKTIAIDRRRTP